jgi:hypothetical protein
MVEFGRASRTTSLGEVKRPDSILGQSTGGYEWTSVGYPIPVSNEQVRGLGRALLKERSISSSPALRIVGAGAVLVDANELSTPAIRLEQVRLPGAEGDDI